MVKNELDLQMEDYQYLPLRDVVFRTLRQAILRGELKPGERLMEIRLANQLGVSRTPIREAIRMLELDGLVIMVPRKGAQVAQITEKDLNDVLEVRLGLEELAVKLACQRITESELQKLYQASRSFEQMLEESFKTIRNGEVVEGTVIDVKPDEIVLNIGYKSDGIITRNEYTNEANVDLTTLVSVGDTMEAKVLKVNDGEGQVLLTYKRLAAEKGSKRLEEAFENKEVLTAKVAQVLDGGLCVIVDETRVFIPASLVSDSYEKDLSKYKDQDIEFVISEFNPKRRRIIGDRKQLLVAKKLEQQKELFAKIKVGDVMEGTVKNVTDFGAFIDLGGADGLLHMLVIMCVYSSKISTIQKLHSA